MNMAGYAKVREPHLFPGCPFKQRLEAENSQEPGGSDVVCELSRGSAMFWIGL